MPKLPRISGREAARAFQKAGWDISRQRGSHVVHPSQDPFTRFRFPCTESWLLVFYVTNFVKQS